MDSSLRIIYYLVLLILLIKSFINWKSNGLTQEYYFPIYALMVVLTELLSNYFIYVLNANNGIVYNLFIFGFASYFGYFFQAQGKHQAYKLIVSGITLLTILVALWFCISIDFIRFNIQAGITLSFLSIILTLIWYFYIIRNPDAESIYSKRAFWFGLGLIIWGSFFIFRIIPMFFFEKIDPSFMKIVQYMFNFINIGMYLLFLRGLLCKPSLKKLN